jgi:hypothetical protein
MRIRISAQPWNASVKHPGSAAAGPVLPDTASESWTSRSGTNRWDFPHDIVSEIPSITLADVHAALAYYYNHRAEIQEEIRKKESKLR